MLVEVAQPVDDRARLLRGRAVVQPDEALAVDLLAEDGEVAPDGVRVERPRLRLERRDLAPGCTRPIPAAGSARRIGTASGWTPPRRRRRSRSRNGWWDRRVARRSASGSRPGRRWRGRGIRGVRPREHERRAEGARHEAQVEARRRAPQDARGHHPASRHARVRRCARRRAECTGAAPVVGAAPVDGRVSVEGVERGVRHRAGCRRVPLAESGSGPGVVPGTGAPAGA